MRGVEDLPFPCPQCGERFGFGGKVRCYPSCCGEPISGVATRTDTGDVEVVFN